MLILSFLTICCQNIENTMAKLSTKLNKLDQLVFGSKEAQNAFRSVYDQIVVQPIAILNHRDGKINKSYYANVSCSRGITK
ncbi:hypothetical protein ACKWTF_015334 [Chironomus riparius]